MISDKFLENHIFCKFKTTSIEIFEIWDACKGMYCVDLDESFQMSIGLQKSASIQPRTSPPKFGLLAWLPRTPPPSPPGSNKRPGGLVHISVLHVFHLHPLGLLLDPVIFLEPPRYVGTNWTKMFFSSSLLNSARWKSGKQMKIVMETIARFCEDNRENSRWHAS